MPRLKLVIYLYAKHVLYNSSLKTPARLSPAAWLVNTRMLRPPAHHQCLIWIWKGGGKWSRTGSEGDSTSSPSSCPLHALSLLSPPFQNWDREPWQWADGASTLMPLSLLVAIFSSPSQALTQHSLSRSSVIHESTGSLESLVPPWNWEYVSPPLLLGSVLPWPTAKAETNWHVGVHFSVVKRSEEGS